MEQCKIFFVGLGASAERVSEQINHFLEGKEVTKRLQSSAQYSNRNGWQEVGTHITIFYKA